MFQQKFQQKVPHCGDIYWANLPTVEGSVQGGRRPVLVLGNDAALRYASIVTIIPITSRIDKAGKIPTHLVTESLNVPSVILPEQIQTINKESLDKYICSLHQDEMKSLMNCVLFQFGFKKTKEESFSL